MAFAFLPHFSFFLVYELVVSSAFANIRNVLLRFALPLCHRRLPVHLVCMLDAPRSSVKNEA